MADNGHYYIIDNKTGGQPYAAELRDESLEMVNAVMHSEQEATALLDRLEQSTSLDSDRLQSLDIYKDGELYIEGTEYFTEQAGIADF